MRILILLSAAAVSLGAGPYWYEQSFRVLPMKTGISSDLVTFVDTIDHADTGYDKPATARRTAFRALINELINFSTTNERDPTYDWCALLANEAVTANYNIYRYWDSVDERWYIYLEENTTFKDQAHIFINPYPLRDIVFEAPHSRSSPFSLETGTKTQGAYLFRQLRGFAFILNGADRCADADQTCCSMGSTLYTGCSDWGYSWTDGYSEADTAHHYQNMFFDAHVAIDQRAIIGTNLPWFVQLHGYIDDSITYEAIVSDASRNESLQTGSIGYKFWDKLNDHYSNVISCQGGWSGATKCGNINVQGRYTNGKPDVPPGTTCSATGTACNSGTTTTYVGTRFIHLEQKSPLITTATWPATTPVARGLRDLYSAERGACRAYDDGDFCDPAEVDGPSTYTECTCGTDGAGNTQICCGSGPYAGCFYPTP